MAEPLAAGQQLSEAFSFDSFRSVDFVDNQTGWAISLQGNIFATKNGGETWEQQESGTTDQLNHVEFVDRSTGWVVYNGWILRGAGRALHTVDAGQTWQNVFIGCLNKGQWDLSFPDSLHGWVVGGVGVIFSTQDGGKTWQQQVSGTKNSFFATDFVDSHNGWAVGTFGTVLHTANGGVTKVKPQASSPDIPIGFRLLQNFPNPFNPTTTIRYSLRRAGWVVLEVYNILGAKVRALENAYKQPGDHQVVWNGLSDRSLSVSSGLYLYQLRFDVERQTGIMLLLR